MTKMDALKGLCGMITIQPRIGGEVAHLILSVDDSPPRRDATDGSSDVSTRPLKVLIVDDNHDLLEMLSLVVEGAGHDVRKAFDGTGALSAARAFQPDVVLLDVGLPDMSGLEVARALRRDPATAAVRLVGLTGGGQVEHRRETADAGFDYHLTKPADPDSLLQLLAALGM